MSKLQALLAPAFAVTALAAVPAQATTFAGNGAVTVVNGTGSFYDSAIPSGAFTDVINYTVPSQGTADLDIIYFRFAVSRITGLTATFNGTPLNFMQVGNSFAGTLTTAVSQGPQTLEISGISSGNGSYAGNVGFSPVPEAATWAMMIAGVGIAGIALRRRRRADGAADPHVHYAF